MSAFFEKNMGLFRSQDYPLMRNGNSYFSNPMLIGHKGEGYFSQYYNERFINDLSINPREILNYKAEILHGRIINGGESVTFDNISSNYIVPISIINDLTHNEQDDKYCLDISTDSKNYIIENLAQNRFHYLLFEKTKDITLSCEKKFIVADKIPVSQLKETKKKLVINIFIDGLASNIFKHHPIEDLMPYTYDFFKVGTIFRNCAANGDWTVPSAASIVTGRYTINHGMFHPSTSNIVGNGELLMSEYFKNEGFLTSQFCANHGKSPSSGYVKGFDKTIYKASMPAEDIIFSALEHLKSFEKRSNFIWLSLFDLHHFLNWIPSTYVQVSTKLDIRNYKDKKRKSALPQFDSNKAERYLNELRRLDFVLNILYRYIGDNFDIEDYTISLCSDHGQPYLTEENLILAEQRTQVPFMIRDSEYKNGIVDDLIENVDILPILLKSSGIDYSYKNIDGLLPIRCGGGSEREFCYCESIYPQQTYQAVIIDEKHRYYFESEGVSDNDGKFKLGNYSECLYNVHNKVNEIDLYRDKVSKYSSIVMKHIENYII